MLFLKRLKTVRRNHWVMSQPIPGSYSFLARYRWPNKIVHLCNIARVLHRYYDLGDYRPEWVTYAIFKIWEKRIMKRCGGYMANPTNPEKVAKEFRARGFVEKSEVNFEPEVDSWVESIRLTPTLVHPELCWHKFDDRFIYDNNIYEFQRNMGIPGWSKAHVAGLDKRK